MIEDNRGLSSNISRSASRRFARRKATFKSIVTCKLAVLYIFRYSLVGKDLELILS